MVTKPIEVKLKKSFKEKMPQMSTEFLMDILDMISEEYSKRESKVTTCLIDPTTQKK